MAPDTAPAIPSVTEVAAARTEGAFPLPVERRYPLDLATHDAGLRATYYAVNAGLWDAEHDVPWSESTARHRNEHERAAAAAVWSWRAWTSFSDISLLLGSLVRSCLELGRSADLKFAISTWATERAVAAEACYRYAEAASAYLARPATAEMEKLIATDPARRALHAGVAFDAFVVTNLVVVPAVDAALTEAALEGTNEPAAEAVLRCTRDSLVRQWRASSEYVGAYGHLSDDAARAEVDANLIAALTGDLLHGSRWPALLDPRVPGAREALAAEDLAAAAGLGGLATGPARAVVARALHGVLSELVAIGVASASVMEVAARYAERCDPDA